jgi:hypothetical protein
MEAIIFSLLVGFILGIFILGLKFKLLLGGVKQVQKLPYKQTNRFFTKSEFAFFTALQDALPKDRYDIFPKVRIADFVDVTATGNTYWTYLNKINRKHVDYLIWDIQKNAVALAIELDGASHNSRSAKERDQLINNIYDNIGLTLKRVSVGSNFENEAKEIKEILDTDRNGQDSFR